MNTQTILNSLLVLHLTGLVVLAGTTFINYLLLKNFWKVFDLERDRSVTLYKAMAVFPRLTGIGIVLLILTGIGMMALTRGVFGEQLWFRVKFGLVIVLILNGVLVGRRQASKLGKIVTDRSPGTIQQIMQIRINLNWFHLVQLIIFFAIIFLSVFKFN
jgi:hypothetical protein